MYLRRLPVTFAGGDKTPVAKVIAARVVTLPLYADLELANVERICGIVLRCAAGDKE